MQTQNNKNKILRAIIYARVSTEEQAKYNFSLENQVEVCKKWVQDHGFTLATEPFVDAGQSAKTMNRPALAKLLEYCRKHKGKVDAVVIYKIDRIARNLGDHTAIKLLLSQNGIVLYSATEAIDNNTAAGKLVENIMATIAQFDNDTKSDRTKDGIRKRISKGEISWVAPRGYQNITKAEGHKTIIPDPELAPLVKRLFEEYSKGIYKVSELTRMARGFGFKTPKGKPIAEQSIHKMLRNKLYAGIIEHKGEEYQAKFEPLVTLEVFNKVQFHLGVKTNNTSHPKRMLNPDFPLRVFAKCTKCGGKFTGSWSRGNGGKYAYYHCAACHKPSVPKMDMEIKFMEFLQQLAPKPDEAKMFKAIVLDAWEQKHKDISFDIANYDKRIQEAEAEKQQVIDLVKRDVFDEETAKEELGRIKEKLALLRLERNDLRIDEFDLEIRLNFSLFFMQNVHRLWFEATLAQKLKFQEMVFPNGVTFDYQTFGTKEIASIYKLKSQLEAEKSTMVPREGLEPSRPCGHTYLKRTCMPIPPPRHIDSIDYFKSR